MLWNSFLQKQVHTGSLQNIWSEWLFEKLPSVLKKDSNRDILLGSCQKCWVAIFFWNTNGQVLPKIQTFICLEHQWMPLNRWVGNCREMINGTKLILIPNNYTKEYRRALDINFLFFPKKFIWEKWIFCNAYAGIYPSSFINVSFWTKIEFSKDLFQEKQSQNYCKIQVGI